MDRVHLKVKDVDEFFTELQLKCRQKKSYSLLEILHTMSVTFDEVQKWAKSNEHWLYILKLCLELCRIHVQDAELVGDLSEEKAFAYLQQNHSLMQLMQS